MKSNSALKVLIIQLLSLSCVAVLAYFVSVENGLSLLNRKLSIETFKWFVVLIITGAFVATAFIFIYTYKISKENQRILLILDKEREIIYSKNKELNSLKKSINSLPQAVSIIGKDDKIRWVNDGFEQMLGFTKDEAYGKKASELMAGPLTDLTEVVKIDEAVFQRKQALNIDVVHYKKDKSSFWARLYISPILDQNGDLLEYIAVSEDISSEVEFRSKLADSERQFKQISNTINSTFYLYDIKEKKYNFISENCKTLYNVSDQKFYSGAHKDLIKIHNDDLNVYLGATKLVNAGRPYNIEYRIIINEEIKWINESSFPIVNQEGETIQNSGICTDITNQKNAEIELKIKSKEVTDSINYAKRIQQATLTKDSEISDLFNDYCLLYLPKSIVSGDFYDISKIRMNDGTELRSIVVADCTGHGVPGAVLAITCSTIIQSTFSNKEIHNPAMALDFCRDAIQNLFRHGEEAIHDGMDVSWVVYNEGKSEIYFSGAHNNCYIVRINELIVIKADREHVAYSDQITPFTNHIIKVEKDDLVFLSTDGYFDQFGGPSTKKFGRKKFYELITSLSDKSLNNNNSLEQTFHEWKGDIEQTDDVCVFGFRV